MQISIFSFGHKHGLPDEADLLFDARILPNPYYVPELKDKTGREPEVAAYAMNNEVGNKFQQQVLALLHFLLPEYLRIEKEKVVIGVGCTGGRHRSVALAEAISKKLSETYPDIQLHHRDIGK
ncbi:MAG: hypothetical protein OEY01_13630 [Desulfobulbaceae bacterium]|nr:hypothetical protein [Desulfobulbaceae bacterium]HIJ79770.1 hypothetical protein [Deltaproteobacteria bacterium]